MPRVDLGLFVSLVGAVAMAGLQVLQQGFVARPDTQSATRTLNTWGQTAAGRFASTGKGLRNR